MIAICLWLFSCMCVCACLCVHACVCMCARAYVCVCVCVCVCVFVLCSFCIFLMKQQDFAIARNMYSLMRFRRTDSTDNALVSFWIGIIYVYWWFLWMSAFSIFFRKGMTEERTDGGTDGQMDGRIYGHSLILIWCCIENWLSNKYAQKYKNKTGYTTIRRGFWVPLLKLVTDGRTEVHSLIQRRWDASKNHLIFLYFEMKTDEQTNQPIEWQKWIMPNFDKHGKRNPRRRLVF